MLIFLIAPSVTSLQQLLNICEQELEWLDMSLNVKKSTCIRIGPRFNANCCNIVTRDGRELAWTNVVRYLGIFIESASCFKCSLDNVLSVLSIGHSMVFLEELVELPRMRLLYSW